MERRGVTTQVKLTWDAPAEGVEWVRGYEVQRATCDGDFTTLAADTGSTATASADASAEAGESYTYRVRARRPQGKSLWSGTGTILLPGGTGESDCAVPFVALPSQVQDPQTGLTPATLENTLLGYSEEEGAGTLEPNEVTFDEDATFRVTSVTSWPGVSGLVLYLTAGSSVQDAALADRDFILEARETVLVVGTTDFSFDDATLSHSDTTGDNEEYTGVVIVTWTEGEPGLVAGETVDFRLVLRNRPEEAQFTQHDTEVVLVKNTGQAYVTGISGALSSSIPKRAQAFTTGPNHTGYTLSSIGIEFIDIDSTSTAGGHLVATLNADNSGNPGASLCTLVDPSSFSSSGVQTFDAPTGCPTLAASKTYFVVIERVIDSSDVLSVRQLDSDEEDTGVAAGWLIANNRHLFASGSWIKTGRPYAIEVSGAALPNQEFNTLDAAGNTNPRGIWSNGTTMWVVNDPNEFGDTNTKIYAYNLATKARDADNDFNTLMAAGNHNPRGLWSDGTTMWVADQGQNKIFAYDMGTKARVSGKDFNALYHENDDDSGPIGIWSDGDTMWVAHDALEWRIHAYDLDDKTRLPNRTINLSNSGNRHATDIWADDTTIFVGDRDDDSIYAYWISNTAPSPDRYISLSGGNGRSDGVWSDGSTMWVSDNDDGKIYAYELPDFVPPPDTLSVEHVSDTMALVKVDISELVRAYGSAEPAVSVSVLGTLSSATMYVHPDGGYARFLLLGLRPETQYTVVASYGVTTRYNLGDAGREVFRTDYARLAGIETSGLTHTETTVKVSLNAAALERGCCFRFYPHSNRGEAERDYTFYLRHKAGGDTAWSDPVELTFSDFTAEAKLTGLDPGTAYDVEVAETEDFMPPQGSAGSYQGTLTVGVNFAGFGYDSDGFGPFPPYGSLSPTTFKLGGVDHSIVELNVGGAVDPTRTGRLFLTFDRALPDDAAFTLTVGTTEFESSDATVSAQTYSWAGGPSLTPGTSVTVELDFTGTVPFREGTTLEGAFATPPMPPTLAFDVDMTVGVDTNFDGYDSTGMGVPQGSLYRGDTFDVGGVQYFVEYVGFEKGTNNLFALTVDPALPYDAFTLTLGSTELSVGGTDYEEDGVLVKNTGQTPTGEDTLSSSNNRLAQQFTTGTNGGGYRLGSIGFRLGTIDETSTVGGQLTVTLNANNNGNPGAALCTLTDRRASPRPR